MTQIPFIESLGDALEAAAAERTTARFRIRRRPWLLIAVAALVLVGGAGALAATLLNSPRALVVGGVACYEGTGTGASAYYDIQAYGRSPQAACQSAFAAGGPTRLAGARLVACADPHGYVAVFEATGSQDQCGGLGMKPVQESAYLAAAAGVKKLVVALRRLWSPRRCVPPGKLIAETQATLDRLGWHGWTARAQQRPRTRGACGAFEGTGAAYSDPGASLDAQNRVVWIVSGR